MMTPRPPDTANDGACQPREWKSSSSGFYRWFLENSPPLSKLCFEVFRLISREKDRRITSFWLRWTEVATFCLLFLLFFKIKFSFFCASPLHLQTPLSVTGHWSAAARRRGGWRSSVLKEKSHLCPLSILSTFLSLLSLVGSRDLRKRDSGT